MTNTHINVGGHKITIGKQASLKVATINSSAFNTNESHCYYCVKNGICFVKGHIVPLSAFTANTLFASGVPTPWMMSYQQTVGTSTVGTGNRNITITVSGGVGIINATGGNTASESYFTIAYPVADDWVES